jgi:two-component system invasion response regulator UvrY
MIKVLIADDHPIFREGVRRILERTPEVSVVGEVDHGDRVVQTASETKADVVLLDISMPGPGHLEVLRQLKDTLPRTRALMFSAHDEAEYAIPALRSGAAGYLMKSFTAAELVEAVRRVYIGRRYVSANLGEQLASGLDSDTDVAPHLTLSARELEVLSMIARGLSLKEIAGRLEINPKTVSSYRARILEKFGVKTNADLVRYALAHDLTDK